MISYAFVKDFVVQEFSSKENPVFGFVKEMLTEDQVSGDISEAAVHELTHYLGNLMIPEYWEKSKSSARCKRDSKLFFKCVYNYSLGSFKELLKIKIIAALFVEFIGQGHFAQMTTTDTSLKRDPEK